MSPIVHVVFFQFRPELTDEERQELCHQMLELKNSCLHPRSEKPYIQSSVGGLDRSIEGAQGDMTHAFVVHFASQQDRDYYVREDPAHRAFVEAVVPKLIKAQILDFSPGHFSGA